MSNYSVHRLIRFIKRVLPALFSCEYIDSCKMTTNRERVISFYISHRTRGKKFTVNHFKMENMSRSWLYEIMAGFDRLEKNRRRGERGRKPFVMDANYRSRLRRACLGKVAPSYRWLARKFQCDDKTIKRRIESLGIKRKKRRRIPKVTLTQRITQWYRLQRLVNALNDELGECDFIQDDESYFKLSDDTHNRYYFTENSEEEDEAVKCIRKEKFEKEVLVWAAISPRGASEILVHVNSKQNVGSSFYRKFCIKDHLLPKIQVLYPDCKYIFWPDNASAHYAAETLEVYEENNIRYLDLNLNPPAMPQIRPIEIFWAHLKQKVYSGGWTAQTVHGLRERIYQMFKTFQPEYFARLFQNTREKIFEAANAEEPVI